MQVVHERCCGLDIHKKTVVACVLTTEGREVRTFGTMTRELLRLADWLSGPGRKFVAGHAASARAHSSSWRRRSKAARVKSQRKGRGTVRWSASKPRMRAASSSRESATAGVNTLRWMIEK